MTKLAFDSPAVRRETLATYRRRALIVEVGPREITIREKGRRDRVAVPYDVILEVGLKIRARMMAEDKKKKKGKA